MIFTENDEKAISNLIAYTNANPYTLNMINQVIAGQLKAAGDMGYAIELESGYRVVYSIEHQPAGIFKHISIFTNWQLPECDKGEPVTDIVEKFGFNLHDPSYNVWVETSTASSTASINILEKE